MNRKTLQKCIDELAKENPKLDYVRGILETLLESLPGDKFIPTEKIVVENGIASFEKIKPPISKDEVAIMEANALAIRNKIKPGTIETE